MHVKTLLLNVAINSHKRNKLDTPSSNTRGGGKPSHPSVQQLRRPERTSPAVPSSGKKTPSPNITTPRARQRGQKTKVYNAKTKYSERATFTSQTKTIPVTSAAPNSQNDVAASLVLHTANQRHSPPPVFSEESTCRTLELYDRKTCRNN